MKEETNPKQIFERYQKGDLDRDSIINVYLSLIEGDDSRKVRLESLEILSELESRDFRVIKLIKSLVVSDSDVSMRNMAVKILIERYLTQSHSEVRWALENEPSIDCLSLIIEKLLMKDKELLSRFLREILKEIVAGEVPGKFGIRRWYYLDLRGLFERSAIEEFSTEELVEIYLNYRTLLRLEDKYDLDAHYCYPMIKDGLVESLDLTGLGIEKIIDIQNLEKFTTLGSLDLSGNKIREISGLECLEGLGYLNLSWNCITEIKNLDKLIGLEGLELIGNQLSTISGLDKLVKLKFLTIGENQIKEIRGLNKLTNLQEINLGSNQISVVKNLKKLKRLRFLGLIGNPIKEIKGLKKLKKMMFKDDIMDLIE